MSNGPVNPSEPGDRWASHPVAFGRHLIDPETLVMDPIRDRTMDHLPRELAQLWKEAVAANEAANEALRTFGDALAQHWCRDHHA